MYRLILLVEILNLGAAISKAASSRQIPWKYRYLNSGNPVPDAHVQPHVHADLLLLPLGNENGAVSKLRMTANFVYAAVQMAVAVLDVHGGVGHPVGGNCDRLLQTEKAAGQMKTTL